MGSPSLDPHPDSFLNAVNTPSSEVPNVAGNEQIDANALIEEKVAQGEPKILSPADNVGGTTATKDKDFNQRVVMAGVTLGQEFPVFAAGMAFELAGLFIGPKDVILLGILKAKGLVIRVVGTGAKKVLRIFKAGKEGVEVVGDELRAIEAEYKAARNAPKKVPNPNGRKGTPAHQADVAANNAQPTGNLAPQKVGGRVPDGVGLPGQTVDVQEDG